MVKIPHRRLIFIFLALCVLVALFFFDPTAYRLAPKCPFLSLTGWRCPGCGIQRAIHALLHGHIAEAWEYNLYLIYSLPYLAAILITEWGLSGKRQARWRRIFEGKLAISLYLVSFFVWGVIRNILNL